MTPLETVVQRGTLVHVVDDDAAVGAAVERRTQRLETLLARRVPQLKIQRLLLLLIIFNHYLLFYKIRAYSRFAGCRNLLKLVRFKESCLSNVLVTYDYDF